MFTAGSLIAIIGLFCLVAVSCAFTSSNQHTDRVCSNIDIRNRVEQFIKLENCTIVEGYLQIVLIENAIPAQFDGVSFPRLRQITGYLLVYRVYGLRSLTRMFPNLSVIRGQTLFHNYAIVIFENNDIEDLGLRSLKRVMRGAIRIEKNAHLCYLNSIDWSRIMPPDVEYDHHFIFENGDPNQCSNICPSVNESYSRADQCSMAMVPYDNGNRALQPLCWNQDYCQIVCPQKCGSGECYLTPGSTKWYSQQSLLHDVQCCHKECLGGCTGPSDADCYACAHVIRDGRCYARCPPGMYEYRRWRCVTESECKQIRNGLHDIKPWKVLDSGHCVEECPPETVVDPSNVHRCIPCEGRCPKVCTGIVVDNIAAAQKLKGCTIIVDVLDIQMRGAFAEAELEENLGLIEEVTGYMQVAHCHTITSLRFMKNLRLIRGQRLHSGRFSLTVFDNQNLQEVWNVGSSSDNLRIAKGAVYFHFNPKLCLSNINQLVAGSMLSQIADDSDISQASNGDQVACDVNLLSLEIVSVTPWGAFFQWQNANSTDNRQLLSWVINYRKTAEENITVFNAKDVCGVDMWTMIDIKPSVDSHPLIEVPLYGLEPFTKYAVYIQMYTISTAQSAAMSPIKYFTTSPSMPSSPRNLVVVAKHPGQLHISWLEPSLPNGIITHYNVYWRRVLLLSEKFLRHNFCIEKLPMKPNVTRANRARNATTSIISCCPCPKSIDQQLKEDQERRFQIEFENFLHDSIYQKKPFYEDSDELDFFEDMEERRRKRSFADIFKEMGNGHVGSSARGIGSGNFSVNNTDSSVAGQEFYMVVETTKKEYELTNLNHFQEYTIEVEACHDYSKSTESKLCSDRVISSARTLPNGTSDALERRGISVKNNTRLMNSIVIKWNAPKSPNGLILLYKIELVRVDVKNYKPDINCITHAQFVAEGGYVTPTLASGNWSIRMHAMSLAGDGPWTEYQYFYVARFEVKVMGAGAIIGIVFSGILLLISVAAIVVWFVRKRMYSLMNEDQLYVLSSNPHYGLAEEAYISDDWEIPRDKIEIGRELGQGSFGMVHEGVARDVMKGKHAAKVAIKTVNSKASIRDRISFLNEASVMKQFDCHHVVKLIGIVSNGWPTLVVMELMANGDLKNFLRRHRPDEMDTEHSLTFGHMLQMAGEIADGMAYLASLKFVHRDLAARNCMVADDLTVKVGDFGMARDIYGMDYYKKGTRGLLPVRWMAPESLKDGIFNTASDVWSYGVVLWEMATLAAQPYQGMSNEEVLHYVIGGGIMEKPEGCPNRLYDMMLLCWRHNPSHRPTFINMVEQLLPDLSERFSSVSYSYGQHRKMDLEYSRHGGVALELADDLEDKRITASDVFDSNNVELSSCQLWSNGLSRPMLSSAVAQTPEKTASSNKRLDVLPQMNPQDADEVQSVLRYRTVNGLSDEHCHSEIGNDLLQLNNQDYSGSITKNGSNNSRGGHKNGLKNGSVLQANNLLATTAC